MGRPGQAVREGLIRCSPARARPRWGPSLHSVPASTRAYPGGLGGVARLPQGEMESAKKRWVRRAMNNDGVEILMWKHRHGSIGKSLAKICDRGARFEDLDL